MWAMAQFSFDDGRMDDKDIKRIREETSVLQNWMPGPSKNIWCQYDDTSF